MSVYEQRHKLFLALQQGTQAGISNHLARSAGCLLALALEERKRPVFRSRDNHVTSLAPGVVITIATSFDAWLNEQVGTYRVLLGTSSERVAEVIRKPVYEKYHEMAIDICGQAVAPPRDLKLLAHVRDEIAHFLPYTQDTGPGKSTPNWLGELEAQKLLITSGLPHAEFHFSQKLASYALAYWACDTVLDAARSFVTVLGGANAAAQMAERAVGIFAFHRRLAAPADLDEFDQRFGLTL